METGKDAELFSPSQATLTLSERCPLPSNPTLDVIAKNTLIPSVHTAKTTRKELSKLNQSFIKKDEIHISPEGGT